MAQKILIKKSTVAAKAPVEAQLDVGELAVNTADALLYTKHSDGSVKLLSPTMTERTKIANSVSSSDARLTNSREWTGATVSQAEAEGGIASTRRAWTAQRVRQAINAWWQLVTSGFGRNLVSASNEAAARNILQLSDAATTTVFDIRNMSNSVSPTADPYTTYRATVFGGATYAVKVMRMDSALGLFTAYSPTLTWSTSDTHAYLTVNYATARINIGAGAGAGIMWNADLYHTANLLNIGTTPATARAALELTGGWVDLRPYLKPGFYWDTARDGLNSPPRIRKLSCGRVELDGVVSFNATSGPTPIGFFVNVPAAFRPSLTAAGLMFADAATPLSFSQCNWIVSGAVKYGGTGDHGDVMVIPLTLPATTQGGALSINGIYWFTN